MLFAIPFLAITGALASSVPVVPQSSNYDTKTYYLPIKVNAQNRKVVNNFPAPKTHVDVAGIITQINQVNSNYSSKVFTEGTAPIQSTFKIFTTVSKPRKNWSGTVQLLVHGLGIDHRYWFNTQDLSLSYAEAAVGAGHAIVNIDRLGNGNSDSPNGLSIVQSAVELEILHGVIEWIKSPQSGFSNATNVVAVGHAYGSALLAGLVVKYPSDVNNVIFTGFSPTLKFSAELLFAFGLTIASQQDPKAFARYSHDSFYFASSSSANDASLFLQPGGYSQGAFNYLESIRSPFTLGVILTLQDVLAGLPAKDYKGGVLVLSGHNDLPLCGGNCYQPLNPGGNETSLLADALGAFPAANKRSTYIPGNTGHAIVSHYTAPKSYSIINAWLKGTYV